MEYWSRFGIIRQRKVIDHGAKPQDQLQIGRHAALPRGIKRQPERHGLRRHQGVDAVCRCRTALSAFGDAPGCD
jgi:hypothetical protein